MSWRARAFLSVLAGRHIAVGVLCALAPQWFTSSSFVVLRSLLPIRAWGVVLIVTGAAAVVAAATCSEPWARGSLVVSAGVTAAWCAAFTAAGFRGMLDAPQLPITWAALVSKDLILSAMPLRTPLEDAARRRGLMP